MLLKQLRALGSSFERFGEGSLAGQRSWTQSCLNSLASWTRRLEVIDSTELRISLKGIRQSVMA